jgi:hypothetical protein
VGVVSDNDHVNLVVMFSPTCSSFAAVTSLVWVALPSMMRTRAQVRSSALKERT